VDPVQPEPVGGSSLWLLGWVWALPVTVFGLVQALVGARFHSVGRWGVLQFVSRERGPVAAFMRRFNVGAYTLGATITYARPDGPDDAALRAHERAHVVQTMIWGPLMGIVYPAASLWAALRGGEPYRDNVFERRARAAAIKVSRRWRVLRGGKAP
jgi:hypothetical protein